MTRIAARASPWAAAIFPAALGRSLPLDARLAPAVRDIWAGLSPFEARVGARKPG